MPLEIGQPAPQFSLRSQHGESVSLADHVGKKNVVLVFYPFAFSGVCTGELCEIRDQITDFSDERTAILAISCDPMHALRAFSERDGLEFPLLSDFWPHGAVSKAYDNFNERLGCSGRATYVIDREGTLRWLVENKIPQARNIDDYRKVLAELG
ncbi:MAG: peroxiredoxin [Nocardioidaceae bacterium]